MKKIYFFFLSVSILLLPISAQESIFLMPRDAKTALHTLEKELESAQKEIKISIYSFTHKTLAKSLKKAAARGVRVRIIFDEEQNMGENYSRLGDLAKIKNIDAYTIKGIRDKKKGYYGKMHMKMLLIDDKKVYFGSANWSYSAFSKNYELLYGTDSKTIVEENSRFFDEMLKSATAYYR